MAEMHLIALHITRRLLEETLHHAEYLLNPSRDAALLRSPVDWVMAAAHLAPDPTAMPLALTSADGREELSYAIRRGDDRFTIAIAGDNARALIASDLLVTDGEGRYRFARSFRPNEVGRLMAPLLKRIADADPYLVGHRAKRAADDEDDQAA